jgi:hypothetical protein
MEDRSTSSRSADTLLLQSSLVCQLMAESRRGRDSRLDAAIRFRARRLQAAAAPLADCCEESNRRPSHYEEARHRRIWPLPATLLSFASRHGNISRRS